jgi:peptidoglycan hydrolase-like protein with peptidoglycan-binding domain
MQEIFAPVGRGGKNKISDAKVVQQLLNQYRISANTTQLKVDGIIGPRTIARIEVFQKSILHITRPDGCVDPNGKTITALLKNSGMKRVLTGVAIWPKSRSNTIALVRVGA